MKNNNEILNEEIVNKIKITRELDIAIKQNRNSRKKKESTQVGFHKSD